MPQPEPCPPDELRDKARSRLLRERRGCRCRRAACRKYGRMPLRRYLVRGAVHTNLLYVVTDTTGRSCRQMDPAERTPE